MVQKSIEDIFEESSIIFPGYATDAEAKPWYSPPGWNGVFLKDLITGKETKGQFSYHLVRIQEHCEVPDHAHDTQWEVNAIFNGNGSFLLEEKIIPIKTGQTFATPPGNHHTVKAGNKELVLTAMFVPALV
ncbi:MAG: cupin domain-containing protein [Methanospirillum sp.]|uniref:cupin domain-containing protein n=1 Tax=Methanospirillum sp. TaxID=45200 RepID=UPI00236CA111|nr:cupin domain-containing protein [Methanospirillum sp.]MDD1729683.1 cupin domain-containing protein [Methanospirillum sp.]